MILKTFCDCTNYAFRSFFINIMLSENITVLRQLSRYKMFLIDVCSDYKRKAICLLDQVFTVYCKPFSDTFGITSNVNTPGLIKCCLPAHQS